MNNRLDFKGLQNQFRQTLRCEQLSWEKWSFNVLWRVTKIPPLIFLTIGFCQTIYSVIQPFALTLKSYLDYFYPGLQSSSLTSLKFSVDVQKTPYLGPFTQGRRHPLITKMTRRRYVR